ncbi:translation initiation factor eIF3 core subunit B [Saccharomycopsis crataegensis]|uniref:Eukaryotic translation initiation factor 3 subunit B n=1 Tax=Saccharomycopsis crataegensis TaxID=43959 RepID=A0AAV5QE10_9ASCO|nr:translation initiation factor eIF3 core subunit B [Saccharomycopsis crataegensis]
MTVEELSIEDVVIDLNEVDFSDIEDKYRVDADSGIEEYVVVDGAPIAPESKVPMLKKVLTKLFTNVKARLTSGEDVDAFHMPIENGKTTGYMFVQFATEKDAELAIKSLNGKKLDAKHRLFLNKLSDVEKYGAEGAVNDEAPTPKVPEFKETDYLKSWLQDESVRDQFMINFGESLVVNWQKHKNIEPAMERLDFNTGFSTFSPKGSYMLTLHPQGIQSWGGSQFENIRKFYHPEVRLLDFSPDEKYMVSLSPEPIKLPPADHPARASFPFGPEDEGHKLIIWELSTGIPVRSFALPPNLEQNKKIEWPLIKWSHDGQYFARKGPDALAVYESSSMALLEKKLIKIEGLQEFEFAPAGVKLAANKKDEVSSVIAYWTPETSNQTARVTLMELPSKKILRTSNLFQVSDCRFHWQDEGKYLCVKVDRHTKSKKTIFSNLEFFNLEEKEIPVEKIELKEAVINFAWEPKTDRFVTISRLDQGPINLAIPKNIINFYAPETDNKKGKKNATSAINLKKYKNFKSIENKHSTNLNWSPKGRFLAAAAIASSNSKIEFFDMDYDGNTVLASDEKLKNENVKASLKQIGDADHFGLTNLEWDPSGRYLAAWSSSWRHKIENGFKIYDFAGHPLVVEGIDNFKQFAWRPRPATLLTGGDRKKVRKMLREYSAQFDEQDAMEASEATKELILNRRRLLEEWSNYRASVERKLQQLNIKIDVSEEVEDIIIEEIKEEIIEEKTEIIE